MKEKSIKCSCIGGEHYLNFAILEEDDYQIYVSLNAREKLPLKIKIKEIWSLITNRIVCYDEVIIDLPKIEELRVFLEEHLKQWGKKLAPKEVE